MQVVEGQDETRKNQANIEGELFYEIIGSISLKMSLKKREYCILQEI